jgi:hypothetical protein
MRRCFFILLFFRNFRWRRFYCFFAHYFSRLFFLKKDEDKSEGKRKSKKKDKNKFKIESKNKGESKFKINKRKLLCLT